MHKVFSCLVLLVLVSGTGCQAQTARKDPDVCYGTAQGTALLLDVFSPTAPAATPRPAVILLHGGGWSMGDKQDFNEFGMALARLGYVAFSINYRLATETANHWPAPLDDAQRAVRWIRSQAGKYRVDPQRLGVMGMSAGGHLAVFLGTSETRDNTDAALAPYSSRVACVVDVSGPTDLTEDFAASEKSGALLNALLRKLLGALPADVPAVARAASPLFRVDAQSAPCLIIHGGADDLVPPGQSQRLEAALQQAGVESKLIVFEGEGHGFTQREHLDRFVQESVTFLNEHLHP